VLGIAILVGSFAAGFAGLGKFWVPEGLVSLLGF